MKLLVEEVVGQLTKLRDGLTTFTNRLISVGCTDDLICELMEKRKYTSDSMFSTLKEVGVFRFDYISELKMLSQDLTDAQLKSWGLLTESGEYILKGRYAIPIRDITGRVTALVGWYPDKKKYVTTPTYGFSKDTQFFNIDCYKQSMAGNGFVYLVEGIFDTLSLRSLGFPAIGNMGLELSKIKVNILKRFGKVIAIPDNDRAGKGLSPFTGRISGKKKMVWNIENDCVFVVLPSGVKDVDDFIKEFDCYDDLLSCQPAKIIKKLRED